MVAPLPAKPYDVALIGAGYISAYHARALAALPGVRLAAVCDLSAARAEALARECGLERGYTSLDEMLAAVPLAVVHVLTPPAAHRAVAREALEAGLHVFAEKPLGVTPEECRELVDLAEAKGLALGVNHNFLFAPPYERLRADVAAGRLGRLDHVSVTWARELPEATHGPYGAWVLQHPAHAMLEVGVHSVAHLLDLVGDPDRLEVDVARPIDLPRGGRFYRTWRVHAAAGDTAVDLNFMLAAGFDQHRIQVRGTLGAASLDIGNNTYLLDRSTRYAFDFDRFHRVRRMGRTLTRDAERTLLDYALSKLRKRRLGEPYAVSIGRSVQHFHAQLRAGVQSRPDGRTSGRFGLRVVELAARIGERAGSAAQVAAPPERVSELEPTVLVLGGTGFIGRELVRQLLDTGRTVRVMARNPAAASFEGKTERLEVVRGDLRNREDVAAALAGIECVYHLAKTDGSSLRDYEASDIAPTRMLADLCLEHGIRRLVFTGTIDSLYLGPGAGTVGDATSVDPHIRRRNNYARGKAMIEELLLEAHRERGLPLVICRPAIVIGTGGNPAHGGVGVWNGLGVCQILGDGRHALPLVLVEDVAAALVAMADRPGLEGKAYNLSAPASLSSLEYVEEIEKHTGFEIQTLRVPAWRFYLGDLLKWFVKLAVGHPDASRRPTLYDWRCREQHAAFDSAGARRDLGWEPVSDRQRLVERGIHLPLDETLR